MIMVCNDGWHEMMLFICSGSTYLVFMAENIWEISLLNILSAATQKDRAKNLLAEKIQSVLKHDGGI